MPRATLPHYLLRIEGIFGLETGAYETWSTGVRIAPDTTVPWPIPEPLMDWYAGYFTLTEVDYLTNQAEPAVRALMSSGAIGNSARVTSLKFNAIGADGLYVNKGQTFGLYRASQDFLEMAGGQPALYPPQVSLVASLTTDAARGLAHEGRMFLPSPPYPFSGDDGRIATGAATGAANAVATFLRALEVSPGIGPTFAPHIISNGGQAGTPTKRRVTGVRVGRVLDTMRSRRAQIEEDHKAVPLVVA